jgi:hypothetical protein
MVIEVSRVQNIGPLGYSTIVFNIQGPEGGIPDTDSQGLARTPCTVEAHSALCYWMALAPFWHNATTGNILRLGDCRLRQ